MWVLCWTYWGVCEGRSRVGGRVFASRCHRVVSVKRPDGQAGWDDLRAYEDTSSAMPGVIPRVPGTFTLAFMSREEQEHALVTLVQLYELRIAVAFFRVFAERGTLTEWRAWSTHSGLVSTIEDAIWIGALRVRTHIVNEMTRIVLKDIRIQFRALAPIVAALPARFAQLTGNSPTLGGLP